MSHPQYLQWRFVADWARMLKAYTNMIISSKGIKSGDLDRQFQEINGMLHAENSW